MSKVQESNQKVSSASVSNSTMIQKMVIAAVFIALTFVITTYINVRIPFIPANGGLVHLGNVPVFIAAVMFGKRIGAITGAVGLGLFDLLNGWVSWAPFTFLICGLIGYAYGLITQKHKTIFFQIVAVLAAVLIKIAGYYIAEGIIYGNWIAPAASIPGNIVQIVVAGIIAVPLTVAIRKVMPRAEME